MTYDFKNILYILVLATLCSSAAIAFYFLTFPMNTDCYLAFCSSVSPLLAAVCGIICLGPEAGLPMLFHWELLLACLPH